MGYWAKTDIEVVKQDDLAMAYTWAEPDGTAVSVAAWDVYFKATAAGAHSTDTITVAPAAIVTSSSTGGTVDTFTITLTATITDVDVGRYDYDIAVDTGTEEKVVFRGTLTVLDRETAVT
jgi:hypothetical protein